MTYDVIVRDGTGHTFGFSYVARSPTDAIRTFKERARRGGIAKFKNIKIVKVEKVE